MARCGQPPVLLLSPIIGDRLKFLLSHQDRHITRLGVRLDISECSIITLTQLEDYEQHMVTSQLIHLCAVEDPPKITEMPSEVHCSNAFDEPRGLPPIRLLDHTVPLLPGANFVI